MWKHQHTSRAFDGWRELTARHRQLRMRAAGHWRNRLVGQMWRGWVEMVLSIRQQREAVGVALGRLRNRLAAAAFGCWHTGVRDAIDGRREKLARAVGRMINRQLSITFHAWRALLLRSVWMRACIRP